MEEGVYIPSDLWPDILKRLPAKKLLQLQCVCKSWKSLISSSSFVKSHSLNTITTTSGFGGSSLRLTERHYIHGGRLTYEESCSLQHRGTNEYTPLGYPNIPNYRMVMCLSPTMVQGLIFLRYFDYDCRESLLCVWNPCIRKQVILTWPTSYINGSPRSYFWLEGVGFDAANNDFKVVRSQLEGSFDVLSVRDGAWRMNLLFPFSTSRMQCDGKGLFFNGSIHWITIRGHYEYDLLRFDCEREEFSVMDLPEGPMKRPMLFVSDLGAGAMLSLAKFLSKDGIDCELWLMQPVSSTWARLDRNHPKFGAAATQDAISCSGLTFEPLLKNNGCFTYIYDPLIEYHFNETMILMDIGIVSSSKLQQRCTY